MAELQIARPTITVGGEVRATLADGLLGLLITEDTAGLARCEAQFGNWGATGARADFLHFDRRVLEFGKDLGFLFETGHELWVACKMAWQNLERNISIHRRLIGFVDSRHAAFTQGRNYLIRA